MPTPLEIRIDELESQLFDLEQNEDSVEVYNGKDIDLSDVAAADTAEYPWQVFEDEGVWKVRHGVFSYRGDPNAGVSGMESGTDFEILIVAAGVGLTEYIALYLSVDLSASVLPAGEVLQAQDGPEGKFPTVPTDTNRYEHLAIGWLEVDENEDVVAYGQWFTGGVVIFTGGG